MLFSFQLPEIRPQAVLCVFLLLTVSSCANVPLHQGATLGSYAGMTASGGTLTKAKLRVDPAPVLAAQTVRIVPTSAQIGSGTAFDPKDLALVTNTIDRALCTGLSDRFKVVAPNQPADLVVRATVTDIVATNRAAAATSTVASLGVAAMLPVPVPRLPIGLGGLSVEAEAVGQDGSQKAAMVWSRGALVRLRHRLQPHAGHRPRPVQGDDGDAVYAKDEDVARRRSEIRRMQGVRLGSWHQRCGRRSVRPAAWLDRQGRVSSQIALVRRPRMRTTRSWVSTSKSSRSSE